MNNEVVERDPFYNANFKQEATFVLKCFSLLYLLTHKDFLC